MLIDFFYTLRTAKLPVGQGVPDAAGSVEGGRGGPDQPRRLHHGRLLLPQPHGAGEGRKALRRIQPRLRRLFQGRGDDQGHSLDWRWGAHRVSCGQYLFGNGLSKNPADWGTLGGYFGDLMNTVISVATLMVAYVWNHQREELKLTQKVLAARAKTATKLAESSVF